MKHVPIYEQPPLTELPNTVPQHSKLAQLLREIRPKKGHRDTLAPFVVEYVPGPPPPREKPTPNPGLYKEALDQMIVGRGGVKFPRSVSTVWGAIRKYCKRPGNEHKRFTIRRTANPKECIVWRIA